MVSVLRICGIGLELWTSVLLAADAITTESSLWGMCAGLAGLVPVAWALQAGFSPPQADV